MRDGTVGSEEAARILGVHRATLLRWAEQGVIEPLHENPGISGAKVFRRADVEKLRLAREKAEAAS